MLLLGQCYILIFVGLFCRHIEVSFNLNSSGKFEPGTSPWPTPAPLLSIMPTQSGAIYHLTLSAVVVSNAALAEEQLIDTEKLLIRDRYSMDGQPAAQRGGLVIG